MLARLDIVVRVYIYIYCIRRDTLSTPRAKKKEADNARCWDDDTLAFFQKRIGRKRRGFIMDR